MLLEEKKTRYKIDMAPIITNIKKHIHVELKQPSSMKFGHFTHSGAN